MDYKEFLRIKIGYSLFIIFLMTVFLTVFPLRLSAKVTGYCANCHTMHNSQNGIDVIPSPLEKLLKDDCLGCHTNSTSGTTIVTLGSSRFPIVYNTMEPVNPLAGGNFYWLENTAATEVVADARGHNIDGIDSEDANLSFSGHHADDSQIVVNGSGGWYRFLPNVEGIEDPDWEQSKSPTKHNEYKGGRPSIEKSMSNFCNGCHPNFYSHDEIGNSSPWQRHPSDEILPCDEPESEYCGYTQYNPLAPVARPDLSSYTGPSSTVSPGTDMVMCLSCHRPHASPYPDIMRWDYTNECIVGTENSSCGCFVCHTKKDGS
jgi:predicted CXXCH cytochrome family protein